MTDYTKVYAPGTGEMFEVPHERASQLVLNHGWSKQPLVKSAPATPTPAPVAPTPPPAAPVAPTAPVAPAPPAVAHDLADPHYATIRLN